MPNFPLTDTAIKAFLEGIYWDTTVRGFGVRVGKNARTFIVLLGEGRRHKLGRYPLMSLADARREARRVLAEKELGKTKPKYTACEDAKNAFLEAMERELRPSTYAGYKSRLNRLDWGRKNLADVTPRDVLAQLNTFNGKPMAKRYAFAVYRAFFNWCVQNHYLYGSPMERLTVPPNNDSRERVLSPPELRAIWHACPDDAFGRTVKLLILTGQRRGEIEHIVLDSTVATVPGKFTKNKRTHTFPVPDLALPLFAQPLGWNGWGKSKARLDQDAQVIGWTLHDLRRTYATIHAQLGTPPHVIEALLNHKSGIISGIAQTYNRYRYLDEMRVAVTAFEKHLARLLESNIPLEEPSGQPARGMMDV